MARLVSSRKTILISINALSVVSTDPQLASLSHQHTGYLDGIGAWLLAKKYFMNVGVRVAGADLWLELIRQNPQARIYCIGSTDEIITTTVAKIESEFPQLTICGFRNGFLKSDEEEANLVSDIIREKPDFVFIATGQPRQELLAQKLFAFHPALYAGLGGSFDVYSGKLDRAPVWIQRIGMEWLYRLYQEPQRWRRMAPLVKLVPLLLRPRGS
ncbi:MAG TPA: WecB/TagA/CpsF family glycosyltransferase [Pedomonas sp.]